MILDLFAGPGGWSEGLRAHGLTDLGIEHDRAACRTRAAAGHLTIRADVSTYPTAPFVGKIIGLIASPPCTDFSTAGKGAGIEGDTGRLILEVPRWVDALRPRWVACEQVPPALSWWELFAADFQALGYMTWTGILNAANYGVPQTRKRAFLLASLDHQPRPPQATHDADPQATLFGDLAPWISMADALGMDSFEAQYQRGAGMIERHGPRPARDCSDPAPTLTGSALGAGAKLRFVRTGNNSHVKSRLGSKAGDGGVERYERDMDRPAPTVDSAAGHKWKLHTNRGQDDDGARQTRTITAPAPAPALTGKAGPQWEWGDDSTDGNTMGQGVKLTVRDALILQSFRPDYPVQGTKTKQFEQVGNAVPPVLATAVLAQVMTPGIVRRRAYPV